MFFFKDKDFILYFGYKFIYCNLLIFVFKIKRIFGYNFIFGNFFLKDVRMVMGLLVS